MNRTQFTFRIDRWDHDGHTIMDHVAGSEDLLVAMAAYEAACRHWPGETITLCQGTRVIEDSRKSSCHDHASPGQLRRSRGSNMASG